MCCRTHFLSRLRRMVHSRYFLPNKISSECQDFGITSLIKSPKVLLWTAEKTLTGIIFDSRYIWASGITYIMIIHQRPYINCLLIKLVTIQRYEGNYICYRNWASVLINVRDGSVADHWTGNDDNPGLDPSHGGSHSEYEVLTLIRA